MTTDADAKVPAAVPLRHANVALDTLAVYSFFEKTTSPSNMLIVDPAGCNI